MKNQPESLLAKPCVANVHSHFKGLIFCCQKVSFQGLGQIFKLIKRRSFEEKTKTRDILISENSSRVSPDCGTVSLWWDCCWVWIDFCLLRLSTKQVFLWVIFPPPTPFQVELTFIIEILFYFISIYIFQPLSYWIEITLSILSTRLWVLWRQNFLTFKMLMLCLLHQVNEI